MFINAKNYLEKSTSKKKRIAAKLSTAKSGRYR